MWIVWLEKKILKTLGILLGVIIILLTAFHFWLVNNAESLLEDIVRTRSGNKLRLKVKNLKFNYFRRDLELQNVVFFSNDSVDQNVAYRFNVNNIKLKVRAVLPIFLEKKILIDSLYLDAPNVEVIQLKAVDPSTKKDLKDVSIPEEMGKVYNSIMDALQLLEVTRFELTDGKFTLINKAKPGKRPLTITNLHFYIDNLRVDSAGQKDKFLFSDQMVFRTHNQDIIFPDGNHRLAFSGFRINIRNQLIEIDSCFLSGSNPERSKSSFAIFFDTLKLVNFDFNALYLEELIKADSVYCLNPDFKIQLEPVNKEGPRKQLPDLDTIIQELTGDLQLNYIGVINASIDITTYRNGVPNSFTSDNNNFEMEGLTINHSRAKPVSLKSFTMAIRNYENFIRDSSYFIRFDSILLRNNKILLSNFSANTQAGRDTRNIQVALFELSDLSWSALLFDKTISASEATLYYPIINYKKPVYTRQQKQQNIFQALGGISDLMDLDRLRIVNGTIKLDLGNRTELQMENASMVVNSQRLVESKRISGIEQSVEEIQFSKAVLKIKDLFAELLDAQFTGEKNQLSIRQARVYNRPQTINSLAKNILLNELQFNEATNRLYANGVNWKQADIEINLPEKKARNNSFASIHLQNIQGYKTAFEFKGEKNSFAAWLDEISAVSVYLEDSKDIAGLTVKGKNFISQNNSSEFRIDGFEFSDKKPSLLKTLHFHQYKNNDTIEASVPVVHITPDVNQLINSTFQAQHIKLAAPVLKIKTTSNEINTPIEKKSMPRLNIGNLEISQPVFTVESTGSKNWNFKWDGNENNIHLGDIKTVEKENKIHIGQMNGSFSQLSLTDSKNKTYSSNEGKINARLENIGLNTADSLEWTATLKEFQARNFTADSIGKKSGKMILENGKIQNLVLSSAFIKNIPLLIEKNPSLSVSNVTGLIITEKNDFRWYNVSFSNHNQSASLDSFSFKPVMSRDSFAAASPYQVDYMTLNTGRVEIDKIDVLHYFNDTVLKIEKASISNPYFTSYRDKRPPFRAGIFKPLPAKLIKEIPFLFTLDTVKITNGTVVYTELNEKTNEIGIIPVARISGDILNIMNYNFTNRDSLRIRLNGYLLDSAWIRLRTRESYTDSLGAFLITVRMRPRSLTYLNSVLMPLASVRLQSGQLDTLNMRAVGTEYLALGEIRMFYHDVKVKFLKNGDEAKKSFLTGLMTFIANSFVIRKQNTKKTAVVYFPRLRDRSFINYYIKIALSGVASSMGAKSNRKMLRRYEKELKRYQLPPIDYD